VRCGGGGTIKVWYVPAGKEALTLRGHTGLVLSLTLSGAGLAAQARPR
jgi:hypothetical protein